MAYSNSPLALAIFKEAINKVNYELKDKIVITKELLSELETKGWQEIEHLQAQLANLAECSTNKKLRQLLKNLLTSYYTFTGGIEALATDVDCNSAESIENPIELQAVNVGSKTASYELEPTDSADSFMLEANNIANNYEIIEPFEYFVDFDEPIGKPLSDEDLYS